MSVLKRDFLMEDLAVQLDAVRIDAAITVQATQTLVETRWLIDLAEHHSRLRGVVGWVPLADERLRQVLETLTQHKVLKGVRHVVQGESDDRFILGEAFNRGVSLLKEFGLIYDILIFSRHLPAAIEFVDRHPEQLFVLDHIAKPTIHPQRFDEEWSRQIRHLAQRSNVSCKFSGVVTEVRGEPWEIELIQPYWDVVFECFGSSRLMFGSDWPVCLLKTSYQRWVDALQELMSKLSPTENANFWGHNAARIYGLSL